MDQDLAEAVKHHEAGRFLEASELYAEILNRESRHEVWHLLGHAQLNMGKLEQALHSFSEALKLSDENALYVQSRGRARAEAGELEAAIQDFVKAIELGLRDAEAYALLAMAQESCLYVDAAIQNYHLALKLQPGVPEWLNSLAYLHLYRKNWQIGWDLHRFRAHRQAIGQPPIRRDELLQPVHGRKILLVGEQGLGDELFFLRFVPTLIRKGALSVEYICNNPKLIPFLKKMEFLDAVHDGQYEPTWDYRVIPIGDLPMLTVWLGADPLPNAIPVRPIMSRDRVYEELGLNKNTKTVGVTFRAGLSLGPFGSYRALGKHVDPDLIREFFPKGEDFQLLLMQRDITAGEKKQFPGALDCSSWHDDLLKLQSLLVALDHYIGVSSTSMHLMASAGGTATVLVPGSGDFRWGYEGDSSPWFPGFQIIRLGNTQKP
ncbi:MAG: tetratricopeptide repeat protein [Candidatus Cloacimonetes bacterium]|nr:tetratricopeptide repeat protein [Candidatus Cloacimonadota bacterium]